MPLMQMPIPKKKPRKPSESYKIMPSPLRVQRTVHPHRVRLPDTVPRHPSLHSRPRLHRTDRRRLRIVALPHIQIVVAALDLAH